MASERTVALGNTPAVCTTHDDGIQTFRVNPHDIEKVEVVLADNLGRTKVMSVHVSTCLALAPTGDFGCTAFDPIPGMRDPEGRPVFLQRITLSRIEVQNMIDAPKQTISFDVPPDMRRSLKLVP